MKVRTATGIGVAVGFIVGGIALGYIKVDSNLQNLAYVSAWWIVVLSVIVPFLGYVCNEQILTGPWGGFMAGLGIGLGIFLLFMRRII
jgi:MFS-type transporter involved in bile tolerance (Atg22 family)